MMYSYPIFPHFYPRYFYNYPQSNAKSVNNTHSVRKNNAYYNTHNNDNHHHNEKVIPGKPEKKDDTIFEIFGIKLHYDDILLICLIFFLYNEGVKDEFLFIALVLLLLS